MPTASAETLPPAASWRDRFYSRGLNRSAGRAGQFGGKAYMGAPAVAPRIDPVRMTATATITTPTPDRSDDVVHPMGVQLDNYRRNPVVFYDHGFGGILLPIGKSEDDEGNLLLEVTEAGIDATTFFSQKLMESAQVFGLIEEGIIKSTSIGFMPLEAKPRGEHGLEITVWELLEYSWVGIPDNPEAVRKCLDRNKLAGSVILEPIRKSLLPFAAPIPQQGRGFTPEKTKMADDQTDETPVDETKGDDTPVDETVEGEPGETEQPLGMQVMSAIRNALKTLGDNLAASESLLENPAVKEYVASLKDIVGGCMAENESKFKEAYPDAKPQEDEPGDEDASVQKFLNFNISNRLRLSGLAKRVRGFKAAKGLSPNERSELIAIAQRLEAMNKAAASVVTKQKSESPDPEITKVLGEISALTKKFDALTPRK